MLKKITILFLSVVFLFVLFQCSTSPVSSSEEPMDSNEPTPVLAKAAKGPIAANISKGPIEVHPVFRMPTNRPGVDLTIFVFFAKGGNGGGEGKKPPKDGGDDPQQCSDPNTNPDYLALPFAWTAPGIPVEYHPIFEPTTETFSAVERAFARWETAAENPDLIDLVYNSNGTAPPGYDGKNVVGWRSFIGRGSRGILAVTYTWSQGSEIIESDIFYNLNKTSWAVNPSIEPGSTECGQDFDIEGIGVHEIGHLIGLDHVTQVNDATMYPSAAKGELKKQTLTPGEVGGVLAVAPAAPAS